MYSHISSAILAGGKSSRMGQNKALMKLGKQTVIERVCDLLRPLFAEVQIISNVPADFAFLNLPVHSDLHAYKGPLAGIHSALHHAKNDLVMVISCDVPLMTAEVLEYLVQEGKASQAAIFRAAGFQQPLPGLYSKALLPLAERYLTMELKAGRPHHHHEGKHKNHDHSGEDRLHGFLEEAGTCEIDPEGQPFYREQQFFNMNRPEDYAQILDVLRTND